ncbi:hypothetical protein CASFOL_020256 [Castilleja foliolosa]|uniref:Leucine-rich repeat-containing N-terminal plant-type domain-containing protein n=1 Tax=Castilleja foliolosa TaxID=1961234 RepID=A0ABD3D357_9LAMI
MENMKSSSILLSIIIIIFLIVEQSIVCCLAKNNITFDCVPREKKALLRFKASLSDPFDRLSSWKTEYYCCSWEGVECDKATGHVIELHLGNRVKKEHDYTFTTPLITLRSERVDSSLMELKYLHYLDLSLCDFQGSSIPASLGSMKHLQHLNLSNANFSGVVPHQLSNLSSLRTLDLGSSIFDPFYNRVIVNDLTWANNLSSLEYLDMSYVNLNRAKDLVKVLGTLPSLLELRMSNTGLDNTNLPHTNCFNSTLFTNVQHLDLRNNSFEGELPCFLRNMTSLSFLDLSFNYFNSSSSQPFPILMNLSYLDLSSNSLNHSATWISDFLLNKYCRLKSLNLNHNKFHGDISGVLKNISKCSSHNLESLELRYNEFHIGHLPEELGELKQLKVLDVSVNQLSGEIPIVLGQLSNLKKIDISENAFEGTLSDDHFVRLSKLVRFDASYNYMLKFRVSYNWANNLSSLEYLDMSHVDLASTKNLVKVLGTLPSLLELRMPYSELDNTNLPHTNCFNSTLFTNVQHLDLSHNYIEGELPCFLQNMTSLNYLDLSYNSFNSYAHQPFPIFLSHNLESLYLSSNEFHGHLPEELGELNQLKMLDVSYNQLSGEIPISLGQLSNLEMIDISNNAFEGTLSDAHFVRLSKLVEFDAGYNYMLKFRVSYNWVPPCQLKSLYLGSVQIRGQIPDGLQTQKALTGLDLSNCSITGMLPKWLSSFVNLTMLSLSNNHIEGPIPELSSTMTSLDLSDNMLINGSIPDSFCQMKSLRSLDLSKNRLSGNLPDCWGNFESLYTARLSSNQFSGDIPNSIGGAYNLLLFQLNNNSFTGQLPTTLKNCSRLILLDVGENKLSGKLPELYIRQYQNLLTVLRLRNNEFYGIIPSSYCHLYRLQIIDLAQNNLTGNIPHCLGNFSGMVKGEAINSTLMGASLSEVMKGVMMEYTTTTIYVINLDLSSNHLVGEIPPEVTNLTGLIGLNLSHNHLRGGIPKKIGDMESLISLDLSSNNLSGTIPESLSKLTFLSHLNLSHNNLSGRIPTGHQLQTLNETSNYEGNSGLCGAPLPKKCHINNETPAPKVEHDNDDDGEISYKIYLIVSIISGLATGFWGYVGVLVFKRSWRLALFKRMDLLIGKILG